jgi:hypothetical protein
MVLFTNTFCRGQGDPLPRKRGTPNNYLSGCLPPTFSATISNVIKNSAGFPAACDANFEFWERWRPAGAPKERILGYGIQPATCASLTSR